MTAADHLAQAELLLAEARDADLPGDTEIALQSAILAAGHALVAIADVLGVAHAPGQQAGQTSAAG